MAGHRIAPDAPMAGSPASQFLHLYQREHATTRKLLGAFPAGQGDFRPHERSSSAHQLAWTFVAEERMMLMALRDQPVMGSGFPKPPETWEEVLDAFDRQHQEIVKELQARGDETLTSIVKFYVAPKTPGDFPAMEFIWYMMLDQIHHRGQLSVYIRMAGGKVPSIYGPTADEPWV